MASLYENYEKVAKNINRIHQEIEGKKGEISSITTRRTDELPLRIANLEEQLKKIDEYQLKIEGFRQLAEKNLTSKNVLTIEAPPGYRVNLNRLRTWSMMIDPQAENDPYAQRVYLVARCDAFFLSQKKTEFEARIAELKADLENGSVDEIKQLEKKISKLESEMREYLGCEEVEKFAEATVSENESMVYSLSPESYKSNVSDPEFWSIGAMGYDFGKDPESNKRLKGMLGQWFDVQTGQIYLPVKSISASSEFAMTVSCVPARKRVAEMDAGIRALLFNIIDHAKTGSRKIYIVDGERQNSALVGSLKSLEDTEFLSIVPRNSEMISNTLEQIVASFSDVDDVLENCDTVAEYNKIVPAEKQIQRSVIVLVGYPNAFEGKDKEYIRKILTNYERYGISFIAVQITANQKDKEIKWGISDYAGEDVINIRMTTNGSYIKIGAEAERSFKWYTFKHNLSEPYASFLRDFKTGTGQKGTEYVKRVDMDGYPTYSRGLKEIVVPYGVDGKDEVHDIAFTNENFAAYLMGASGSGKSTLLHTIITGIINKYHPDDVELWLADFKMSEFAQYMDPLPPHVKYILLDESQELVYDLIDQLTEKMMERQRFFMQNRDLKKVEMVPSKNYMPVIFVILDEFSIMSQVVAENESYKLKLQNLLAKGRALGIKFIFSSQTFTRGIAGLSGTAKDQIQARIAMKNTNDEITNTLELSAANKTEQVKAWMDALPPHYALIKYREGDHTFVKRLKVMYFAGNGSKALEPQRKLIRSLNENMRKVSIAEYGKEINTYVDKRPVIVDGNSFKVYDANKIAAAREEYLASDATGFKDDIFVSLGDPRKMVSHKFIAVSNESRENLLVVGRNAESACVMSVLMSVIKQFEAQGTNIHVWAYVRNRLYHEYKEEQLSGFEICEGVESVSLAVREIKDKIANGVVGNDLYVLLGMEQLAADFELLKGNLKSFQANKAPKVSVETEKLVAASEDEQNEVAQMHEEMQDLETYLDKKEEELMEKGLSLDEIMEELEKLTMEFYAKQASGAELNQAEETESEEAEDEVVEADEAEDDNAEEIEMETTDEDTLIPYDASTDFKEIVAKGSRYGYHFLMCLNTIADLKSTKTDVRMYNHKLAFQMSGDDSTLIYGNKIASKIPEHICQYSNGMEKFSFRPYLHKGIGWDGWSVGEDGQICDPSLINNEGE